ncbi:MAG: TIGR00159 family protein [Leptonema sp. (in: Bacteria)]|nr:TIGR00159 family protein [Leptonema sp. (in: bacteria)]
MIFGALKLDSWIQSISPLTKVLDILLVAYLFYRVYILLSRTRAIQLLFGFALIIAFDILSRKFNLETLSWIINNVSTYLVFGIIVLLQPELRRLISEIGKMPIFQWVNPPKAYYIDEIVIAAQNMAQEKVGSLICILKEIKPQQIIDAAVKVDANITHELLETIFFKDSPLHDGAVIIESNRILAASCYLPMGGGRELKKTMGARHRAAFGFSEESDAVIIVTSEETGKISVMYNGRMIHSVATKQLKPTIQSFLSERTNVANPVAKPEGAH